MSRIVHGLLPTPADDRDLPLGGIVGHARLEEMPDEYSVGKPLVIKDQGVTDMCTAYALTSVSEDQEGIVLDPFFTFGATKFITGEKDEWGADLRSACKSAVPRKIGPWGFLPAGNLEELQFPANQTLRNEAADWEKIDLDQMDIARKYAKQSFFAVDGPHDVFDNIRSAMWRLRDEKRSVLTGCKWRQSWTYAEKGVVRLVDDGQWFGHAVKAFGWRGDFLQLQLSNGKDIGDGGIFWVEREVVNDAFSYGAFTFLDMPREDAEAAIAKTRRSLTFFEWIRSPFQKIGDILFV